MADKIYIVTSGDYSEYHIDAVFKDKTKAEKYCSCHDMCTIEEYGYDDNKIFTPFNYVRIYIEINIKETSNIQFVFGRGCAEDRRYLMNNYHSTRVSTIGEVCINLSRRLPDVYDENIIKNKYTKVFYDLLAELKYVISDFDLDLDEQRDKCKVCVDDYLKEKFGSEDNAE